MSTTNPLSKQVKVTIGITTAAGASASTPVTSAIIDMQGFEAIMFIVAMGPITAGAVTSIKAQQDDDAAGGTMEDVAGTNQAIADSDDNKVFYVDWFRPAKRYVQLVVTRGTQAATVGSCLALQYAAGAEPVTQGSNVGGELHVDKIAGTA